MGIVIARLSDFIWRENSYSQFSVRLNTQDLWLTVSPATLPWEFFWGWRDHHDSSSIWDFPWPSYHHWTLKPLAFQQWCPFLSDLALWLWLGVIKVIGKGLFLSLHDPLFLMEYSLTWWEKRYKLNTVIRRQPLGIQLWNQTLRIWMLTLKFPSLTLDKSLELSTFHFLHP